MDNAINFEPVFNKFVMVRFHYIIFRINFRVPGLTNSFQSNSIETELKYKVSLCIENC